MIRIDPLAGFLREMGLTINAATFKTADVELYIAQLENLQKLDAGQWNCDYAYSRMTDKYYVLYLLAGKRAVVFQGTLPVQLTPQLISEITAVWERTDLFDS